MKSEWKQCQLGDIVSLTIDRRGLTPKKLGGDWADSGYRALSAKNIKTGKIVQPDTIRFVNAEMYNRWMPVEIERGDIIITSEAPFGEVYYWNSDEKIVLSQRLFAVRICPKICSEYIYYYMMTGDFQGDMRGRATGTTVIGLRQPELMKCAVRFPDLPSQQRIASILRTIDERITLNKEINDNLEQQAQAYFQELFVDNANSEWTVGTISNLGTVVGGSTPSKAKPEYYTEAAIAWITPKDLSVNKSKFISHGENDITELGLRNSSANIMPEGTVLFSSRAPIGYIAISSGEVTTNQGFKSVVPGPEIGTAFVYYFLKHNLPLIEGMASGSTFKEVSGSTMKNVPATIPDPESLAKFNEFCTPIFTQQRILEEQTQSLAILRDSLLPKLMSGELDVSEVSI